MLAEEFVTRTGTRVTGTTQFDRLNALTRAGVLVGWSREAFDKLRRGAATMPRTTISSTRRGHSKH
ncbi:hypothetical protein [Streptomyces sp. WM6386]|uniref:hypothetical protein n=1 Tax=Streptomyces sp. WM6386 TaxID=1415558 RepID=UPI000695CB7E|nr:hypothetical protein [Streptomyces sp. WM6386]